MDTFKVSRVNDQDLWESGFLLSTVPFLHKMLDYIIPEVTPILISPKQSYL